MAEYSEVGSDCFRSAAACASTSDVITRGNDNPFLRADLVKAALPNSIAFSRRSLENHALILDRARGLLTKVSQSRLGPASSSLDVKISITSPLRSSDSNATSFPFTRAPTQRCPTSVWTA